MLNVSCYQWFDNQLCFLYSGPYICRIIKKKFQILEFYSTYLSKLNNFGNQTEVCLQLSWNGERLKKQKVVKFKLKSVEKQKSLLICGQNHPYPYFQDLFRCHFDIINETCL